ADKNPGNVAGGLKAAIHNPNVSEEAKQSSAQRLQNMGEEVSGSKDEGSGTNRQLGGHKAALKNPNVSEEAKEHSAQVLREAYDEE
ncbi:hypothetical protein CVT26_008874, partial [Gymnopilus dilepis]